MQFTRHRARAILAVLWLAGGAIVFLTILIQTFGGVYGDKYVDAWGWFLPTIMPTASLIISVFVAESFVKTDEAKPVQTVFFGITFAITLLYLIVVAATLFAAPISSITPLSLMKNSHLWLAPLQSLVSATMGAFFVSNEKGTRPQKPKVAGKS